jgi:hypothetical protein
MTTWCDLSSQMINYISCCLSTLLIEWMSCVFVTHITPI